MTVKESTLFWLKMVKVAAGVAGVSLVLTENHPYITTVVLIIGAVANEALEYFKRND